MAADAGEPSEMVEQDPMRAIIGRRSRDAVAERQATERIASALLGTPRTAIMVSRYVLLEKIGQGGLGLVYSAYDPDLDRRIAVKLLRTDGGNDPSASQRLLREAQAMARLAHPNVVAVHDVGLVNDPVALPGHEVFVAMELIEGETLASWLARADAQRSWTEIRDVLVQAAWGLAAAHDAGLVHRDFKPTNVLIGRDGRVRVLDFGLARPIGDPMPDPDGLAAEVDPTHITPPGALLGTPPYMSPEQIAGGEVGPASDQFSFCVTLFESLYGFRPFQAASTAALLRQISDCEPPARPSPTNVPLWLHRVVLQGLQREPAQRFDSMANLVTAATADRRSKRRQRVGLILAIALSASTAAVASWTMKPEPTLAEREDLEARVQRARAAAADGHYVYPGSGDPSERTAYQILLELEHVSGNAGEAGRARASALRDEFADTLIALGDAYRAQDDGAPFAADFYAAALVFRPDDAHARAQTSLTPGELSTLGDRAARGDFGPGEVLAGRTLAVLSTDDADERRARTEALLQSHPVAPTTAARLRSLTGVRPTSTPPPLPSPPVVAAAAAPATPPPAKTSEAEPQQAAQGSVASAKALHDRAIAALEAGNDAEAERLFHRALQIRRRHAPSLAGLSRLHFDRAEYHKAVEYGELAVAAAPRNGRYHIGLGDAHVKVLAYAEARAQYERARELGDSRAKKRLQLLDSRLGRSLR